jgi:hypothetical protein
VNGDTRSAWVSLRGGIAVMRLSSCVMAKQRQLTYASSAGSAAEIVVTTANRRSGSSANQLGHIEAGVIKIHVVEDLVLDRVERGVVAGVSKAGVVRNYDLPMCCPVPSNRKPGERSSTMQKYQLRSASDLVNHRAESVDVVVGTDKSGHAVTGLRLRFVHVRVLQAKSLGVGLVVSR